MTNSVEVLEIQKEMLKYITADKGFYPQYQKDIDFIMLPSDRRILEKFCEEAAQEIIKQPDLGGYTVHSDLPNIAIDYHDFICKLGWRIFGDFASLFHSTSYRQVLLERGKQEAFYLDDLVGKGELGHSFRYSEMYSDFSPVSVLRCYGNVSVVGKDGFVQMMEMAKVVAQESVQSANNYLSSTYAFSQRLLDHIKPHRVRILLDYAERVVRARPSEAEDFFISCGEGFRLLGKDFMSVVQLACFFAENPSGESEKFFEKYTDSLYFRYGGMQHFLEKQKKLSVQ